MDTFQDGIKLFKEKNLFPRFLVVTALIYVNRPVRTRMPSRVGAGGAPTRLFDYSPSRYAVKPSFFRNPSGEVKPSWSLRL